MGLHAPDAFTDSLARRAGHEQKAVQTTAFDLQLNPVNPGIGSNSSYKVRQAKPPWNY